MVLKFTAVVLLSLCLVPVALGQWLLTDVTFDSRTVEPVRFDGQTLALADGVAVPAERIVEFRRVDQVAQPPAGSFVLHLTGGDRLVGAPEGIEGEKLRYAAGMAGGPLVPLERLVALTRAQDGLAPNLERGQQDVVRLANGDVIRGIVTDLTEQGVSVSIEGNTQLVPMEALASVAFADLGLPAQQPAGWALTFDDANRITVPTFSFDGELITFSRGQLATEAGDDVQRNWRTVTAVEHVGGPVVWASDLQPVEAVHTPYLAGSFPHRMNQSVAGQELTGGGRSFARGIGVHARSRLVFDVPDGATRFRTGFAIPSELPLADVTVRIKADDAMLAERQNVKAGEPVEVVEVDVAGKEQLTLEVDYGQGLDVQDRLNWIEPAFIR